MITKIEKKWFVRFQGDFFATQFFGCETETDVRTKARDFLGVNRLPNNTDIWCNEEEVRYDS
jgi:hypothetical protein